MRGKEGNQQLTATMRERKSFTCDMHECIVAFFEETKKLSKKTLAIFTSETFFSLIKNYLIFSG